MNGKGAWALMFCLLVYGFSYGQQSATRCKTLPSQPSLQRLDSLVVLPASIYVEVNGEQRFDFVWNQDTEMLQLPSVGSLMDLKKELRSRINPVNR